jgi:Transposase DDE domain
LPFALLVILLLNLRKGSADTELQAFFDALQGQPLADTPSRSAFCKARLNLDPQAFAALNQQAVTTFVSGFAPVLWQGRRILAVDGSTLRLPVSPAIEDAFGAAAEGPPLARISLLYAVGHQLVLDAPISALCVSERELALDHLEAIQPNDVALYDRGYAAFWLLALHHAKGRDFCMRLSRSTFAAARPFWTSDVDSQLVTLTPSAYQRRTCRDQGLSAEPLQVRLVRVRLRGGETEVLITSLLDEQRYPTRLFAALYHQRWGVEEHIKREKRWAELESFSGFSPIVIQQDFHANILALTLAAMHRAMAEAVARRHFADRRQPQQVRWTNTLSALKNTLVCLLLHTGPAIEALWCRLIGRLARAVDGVRPDRIFPRDHPGKLKIGPHMNYKRTA